MSASYRYVGEAADVTDEIYDAAVSIADAWYPDGPIDWPNVYDRLDGLILVDGGQLDLGDDLLSPALTAIRHHVTALRRG